ncbi:MAG: SH3 domain-containing protein [Chloroflexi bacterium]|nr:SH3 domain-containing protein [Chloroflexota bacterium]MCC6891537.1 SH3 domain-containing protein [Anaerolineae bacterium]
MKRTIGLFLVMLVCAGCNLSRSEDVAALPTDTPAATAFPTASITRTPISIGVTELPTLLPLPGISITISTPQPTLIPVTSVPLFRSICQVYTTYSGADPRNTLSLRTEPNTTAPQVFRVPTNQPVMLIPNTGEMQGDGYHWLNVLYVDGDMRYIGWMARDSFSTNGQRDPSIATLRHAGTQADC